MWGNKGKSKNTLTLVGLELTTPSREAQVLTMRPLMLSLLVARAAEDVCRAYLIETSLGGGGRYTVLIRIIAAHRIVAALK